MRGERQMNKNSQRLEDAAICCTSAARSFARCWAIPHRLQPGQSAPDATAIDGR